MHVATTRRHYKDKVYETHLLRRSFRDEQGRPRNETLANLSHLPGRVAAGLALAGALCVLGAAFVIDGNADPELRREDWREVAAKIRHDPRPQAVIVRLIGLKPLELYAPSLRTLRNGAAVREVATVDSWRFGFERPPTTCHAVLAHAQRLAAEDDVALLAHRVEQHFRFAFRQAPDAVVATANGFGQAGDHFQPRYLPYKYAETPRCKITA
jgi:hypothetical protein